MPWVARINTSFNTPGVWRYVALDTGTDIGPVVVVTDGSDSAAQGLNQERVIQSTTEVTQNPESLYRVTVVVRTKTAPTAAGNVYGGVAGYTAAGQLCNTSGQVTNDSQAVCSLRATMPPATYTTYVGYIYGHNNPGDGGPNNSITAPMRTHPNVAKMRGHVRLLNGATTGEQLLSQYTLDELVVALTLSGTSRPRPGATWPVTLRTTTDGVFGTDYDTYTIYRDGAWLMGDAAALPATINTTQNAGTTSTYRLMLEKNGVGTISSATATVSTIGPAGKTLVSDQTGAYYAWVEIQQWPERRRVRRSSTLAIMQRPEPVVVTDIATMAESTITFLTRTETERANLEAVLMRPGPLQMTPACATIPTIWFMPGDYTMNRVNNRADNTLWLTDCAAQEVLPPS